MGFFKRIFGGGGKAEDPARGRGQDIEASGEASESSDSGDQEGGILHLAFVLLRAPEMPSGSKVAESFERYRGPLQGIELPESDETSNEVQMLELKGVGTAMIALMDFPVPEGEADKGVSYSLSSIGGEWELGAHGAHLMVSLMGVEDGVDPITALMAFTSLLAAVTATCDDSLGVYWGNAGATHEAEFLTSVAEEFDIAARITLWNGLSIAEEADGRVSLLSLGMSQLNLPDLLCVGESEELGNLLERFFSLLGYVATRGAPIPDGDTIGVSEQERIPVNYVPSPIDPDESVWRVEFL